MRLGNLKLWHIGVILCLAVLATTPKFKSTGCLEKITLANYVSFSFNCDSPSMTAKLLAPQRFFNEFHNWKGRPVYFTYGLVSGYILSAPTKVLKPLLPLEDTLGQGRDKHISKVLNFYLAYFILNIAIVFISCWLAIRISGLKNTTFAAAALALVIASLDVVEGGVFLLHTVIMNLPVAIGACFYCILGSQFKLIPRYAYIALGLIIGLCILVYPAFAILIPAFFCGVIFNAILIKDKEQSPLKEALVNFFAFLIFCILPVLGWTGLNQFVFDTGTYLTLDKGQFKWLPKALAAPNSLDIIEKQTRIFFKILYKSTRLELFLALIAFGITFAGAIYKNRKLIFPFRDIPLLALLIALLGVLSFNYLQGYYAPRLHYSITALLYIAIMRFAMLQKCEKLTGILFLGVAAAHFYDAFFYFTTTGD